jgi:hypothetical protein
VGKRSSSVAKRRRRREDFDRLVQVWVRLQRLRLESFLSAAIFARSEAQGGHDRAWSIAWLSANCGTTEAEAADWIDFGEAILNDRMIRGLPMPTA